MYCVRAYYSHSFALIFVRAYMCVLSTESASALHAPVYISSNTRKRKLVPPIPSTRVSTPTLPQIHETSSCPYLCLCLESRSIIVHAMAHIQLANSILDGFCSSDFLSISIPSFILSFFRVSCVYRRFCFPSQNKKRRRNK